MKRTHTQYIVIHCSATREDGIFTFEDCEDLHVNTNGWSDIGYHFYVERDGRSYVGRGLETKGAHVRGYNRRSVAVCYEGGLDEDERPKDTRTEAQKQTILKLVSALKTIYPEANIVGHRDLFPDRNNDGVIDRDDWLKECPCYDVQSEFS